MGITTPINDGFWNHQLNKYTDPERVKRSLLKNPLQTFSRIAFVINLIPANNISYLVWNFFFSLQSADIFTSVSQGIPGSEKILESFYLAIKSKNITVLTHMNLTGMPLAPLHIELAIRNGCFSQLQVKMPLTDDQKNHYLYLACKAGNESVALHMAEQGANIVGWAVKHCLRETRSPLTFAYENGHKELCKKLLLISNYQSDNFIHQTIMGFLKADVRKNNDWETLRFISSFLGEKFDESLELKSVSETPLQLKFKRALLSDNKKFLDYLMQNFTNRDEIKDCLTTAVELSNLDYSMRLFEMLNKIDPISTSSNPLRDSVVPIALKNGMNAFIELYLETLPDELGQVLRDACAAGNVEIADLCLQKGAKDNWKKLIVPSIESCHIETVRLVMNTIHKSRISNLLRAYRCDIHEAMLKSYITRGKEILLLLAEFGFDLFHFNQYMPKTDPLGTSCFHKAALLGWNDVIELGLSKLVHHDDKLSILNKHSTLISLVSQTKHDSTLASLVHAGFLTGDVQTLMRACSKNGLMQTLKSLLETHPQDFSMLTAAVNGGQDEIAHLLLQGDGNYISLFPDKFHALCKVSFEKKLQKTGEAMLGQFKDLYMTGASHIKGQRILYPSQFLQETLSGETINTHKIVLKGSEQTFYVNLDILQMHPLFVEFISKGVIEGIDPEHFEHLLSFLLNKELPDSHGSVKALIAFSNRFELYDLQMAIEKWIQPRPECNSWLKKLTLISV